MIKGKGLWFGSLLYPPYQSSALGIGKHGFILQNHDSPENGFSAPKTKRSLVVEIKCLK